MTLRRIGAACFILAVFAGVFTAGAGYGCCPACGAAGAAAATAAARTAMTGDAAMTMPAMPTGTARAGSAVTAGVSAGRAVPGHRAMPCCARRCRLKAGTAPSWPAAEPAPAVRSFLAAPVAPAGVDARAVAPAAQGVTRVELCRRGPPARASLPLLALLSTLRI